jgi:hypothetical protein
MPAGSFQNEVTECIGIIWRSSVLEHSERDSLVNNHQVAVKWSQRELLPRRVLYLTAHGAKT